MHKKLSIKEDASLAYLALFFFFSLLLFFLLFFFFLLFLLLSFYFSSFFSSFFSFFLLFIFLPFLLFLPKPSNMPPFLPSSEIRVNMFPALIIINKSFSFILFLFFFRQWMYEQREDWNAAKDCKPFLHPKTSSPAISCAVELSLNKPFSKHFLKLQINMIGILLLWPWTCEMNKC